MSSAPSEKLEVFDNPAPERDYVIHMEIPEFTCLCPLTGQPDFATLIVDYIADEKCLELKSIKLYTWILSDFVNAIHPRYMRIRARWWVRGGIYTTVIAEHRKEGWTPAPVVHLPDFETNSPMRG
mgnify:CR=1 FL=1